MKNHVLAMSFLTSTALMTGTALAAGIAAPPLVFTVQGVFDAGSPTYNRVVARDLTSLSAFATDVAFARYNVRITDAATYRFDTVRGTSDPQLRDPVMTLYRGSFDPNDPLANAVAYDDDSGDGLDSRLSLAAGYEVAAGDYILVVGTFSNGDLGSYTFTGSGGVTLLNFADGSVLGYASAASVGVFRRLVSQAGRSLTENAGGGTTTRSTRGTGTGGGANTWIEVTGFAADGDNTRQSAVGFQLGGDIAVTPSLALGLSVGHSTLSDRRGALSIDGDLTFLQPYLAYSIGAFRGEASLFYGRGDIDQTGPVGGADTRLIAASVTGAYDIALSNGSTLSPMGALSYGEARVEGRSGALAGAGDTTGTFGEASLGARYTTPFDTGRAYVGLHLDYAFGDDVAAGVVGLQGGDDLSGRIELGVDARIADRIDLRVNGSYGGIGGDAREVSANIQMLYRF